MASKHFILTFILYILVSAVECDRKLAAQLNPGCGEDPSCKSSDFILFHVKAEGESDTLHHLWDFTPAKKPSLLLVLTEKNASVSVNWPNFKLGVEGAVNIDSTPKYVYGTVIDKVIEFNDENDSGMLNQTINNSSYVFLLDTVHCAWQVANISNTSTSGDISLTVESSYLDGQTRAKKNGTIRVVVTAFAKQDHAETLPHLMHTDNATQMDITLDNLATQYKNTRFGLRMVTFSSDSPNTSVEIRSRKTMDDEHAPGVFEIVEVVTASADTNMAIGGGFLQWRPVVYTSATRDMTVSTETISYSLVVPTDTMKTLNKTLPFSVFGSKLLNMLVVATNVTFGIAADGFYHKGHYAEWSVMMGYGQPPEETFSMLVALVLLIGLGLPAVVILTGTVCIVLRRLQRNKDDLFLSR